MNLSEENRLYQEYEQAAKAISPPVAVMSIQHWRDEGRPTAQYWYVDQLQPTKAKGADIMSDPNATPAEGTAAAATTAATKQKKERAPGAKALVRKLFETDGASYTLEEMEKLTGKPASSITTAISDLKSDKYCKPGDPLVLHRHKDGKYSLTPEVVEAAPEGTAAAAGGAQTTEDVLPQA